MKNFFASFLVIMTFSLFLSSSVSWPQQEKDRIGAKKIKGIVLFSKPDEVQAEIKGDGFFLNYSIIQLSDPPRLVLDFPGIVNASKQSNILVGHPVLNEIRIGEHPQKTRVVFEFSGGKIPFNQIDKKGDTLILLFFKTGRQESSLPGKKESPTKANNSSIEYEKSEIAPSQTPEIHQKGGGEEKGRGIGVPEGQKHIYSGRKISLEFKDSDIRLVFQKISEETNQNIVVSEGVQGKISLRLIDVPWDQALDTILESRHLAIIREGNGLRIVTQKEYDQKKE